MRYLLPLLCALLPLSAVAGLPLWTFQPLTATSLTVLPGNTAVVQYRVTNQSRRPHVLMVRPVTGIAQDTSAGNCSDPFLLAYQASCTLRLTVSADTLTGDLVGGPVVCDKNSLLQCYQPSAANQLAITKGTSPPTPTISVAPATLTLQVAGQGGTVTVTNTSTATVNDLMVTIPSLSQITLDSAGSSCTPTLGAGASCTFRLLPGFSPEAGTAISVAGSNTAASKTVTVTVIDPLNLQALANEEE